MRGPVVGGMLLAALWGLLAGAEPASWLLGGPAIVAALVISAKLGAAAPARLSVRGTLHFAGTFLWRSLVSGFDVAARALAPSLPIAPTMRELPLRLPADSAARVVFAGTINLMPGTLCAELGERSVIVHLLSSSPVAIAHVIEMEEQVAGMFGIELAPPSPQTPPGGQNDG